MLLIKNPRIFHNISIRFTNVNTLVIVPFSINSRSSFEDFFIFAFPSFLNSIRLFLLLRSNYEKPCPQL